MASPAQIHANRANAQRSTGPVSPEGKARSARNSFRHGFTVGLLVLTPAEAPLFRRFEADLRAEIKPAGPFQQEAFQQFVDAYWRLRKITTAMHLLIEESPGDPFVSPAAAAPLRQLTRYRAAAEMALYRSIKTLRDLQTVELQRALHLTAAERSLIPPLVDPGPRLMAGHSSLGITSRELYYQLYGAGANLQRFQPPPPTATPPPDSPKRTRSLPANAEASA